MVILHFLINETVEFKLLKCKTSVMIMICVTCGDVCAGSGAGGDAAHVDWGSSHHQLSSHQLCRGAGAETGGRVAHHALAFYVYITRKMSWM